MLWHSIFAPVLLACLNGMRIGPVVCLTGICVGLMVSVGCSAWWWSSDIVFDVQVEGKASSVWLLESNVAIWAVLVLILLFSSFLWLNSRLATFSASAGSMVTMVTRGGDLQPGSLADRLLTGLGQPQINP